MKRPEEVGGEDLLKPGNSLPSSRGPSLAKSDDAGATDPPCRGVAACNRTQYTSSWLHRT